MSRFRVVMINIDFYPLLGGAQMHTLRLCRYLRLQGVDAQVITRHHPGLKEYDEVDGVPVYRTLIRHPSRAGASLSFTYYALKHISAIPKSNLIVHSHEMLSPMTIGLLSRATFGTRLVVNPHRGGYLGDMYKLQKRRKGTGRLRLAWASRAADAFISVSKEISSEMMRGGIPARKIHFIPYALDTAYFQPPAPDRRSMVRRQLEVEEKTVACYTGRLVPEKGLPLLLDAWAEVRQSLPSAFLLIVGDGEQRQALEDQACRLGIAGSVRFTGQVNDTAPYLQASDLYVQPSFTEGLPISMLEAMACGLPVLATAVGGVPDLIRSGENGQMIPSHDTAQLRENIMALLANASTRKHLGDCARDSVVAYCSIDKIGQDHIQLYQQILES